MADFETTTDEQDAFGRFTRVWAWGLANIIDSPDTVEDGLDIQSFFDRISRHNSTIWFHNLKFDGQFILPALFKKGFVNVETEGPILGERGTFKTLISDMGTFYSITVKWWNGHMTEFRDSYKKVPMTVRRAAEAWKLPISKGELDYKKHRPVGHQLTPEERDYLHRDVSIMAFVMRDILASGATRLTVGSDALAEYKRLVDPNMFKQVFPVLSADMDAEIRRALRGGWTYGPEGLQKRVHTCGGIVLDVNSLYPFVMATRYLPYGEPQWVDGKVTPTANMPLTIFSITFTAKLKPNHLPCIQIKGTAMFGATEYLKEIKEPTTLMMTNVDFDLYMEHYDMDIIMYGGGWRFKAAQGLFETYIDKWSTIKANSKGGKREIAKLHLNSLWGKYTMNPNVSGKYPEMDDEGIVQLKRGSKQERPPIYTALGCFVTAYARDITIRAAQANFDSFAYADTDSLHLLRKTVPEGIEVDPTKLGAWKLEYTFESALYVRAKAYMERLHDRGGCKECAECEKCAEGNCLIHRDGHYTNRVAGLPEQISEQLTFADVEQTSVFHGKLKPLAVRGGIVLIDTPYTLNV
jgi:hypothetical protein